MNTHHALTISLLAVSGFHAFAAPTAISLVDFSGSETVIDFNAFANEEEITTQYSGQGVVFGAGLYGMTNPGDTAFFPSNGGGVIASNWRYSLSGFDTLTIHLDFAATKNKVGFFAETNDGDDTTISIYSDGNLLGSHTFDTAIQATFIGLQDPAGFNNLDIVVRNNYNGFLAIDDLRFEGASSTGVPDGSSTVGLLAIGIGSLLSMAKMRR